MRRSLLSFSLFSASLFSATVAGFSSVASAAGIGDYHLTRTFTLPTPTIDFSSVLIDALPDGRLLAINGTQALRETAVGSGMFTSLGSVANYSTAFGASFLSVSPDGTKAAVGANNGSGTVTVFNIANPTSAATSTAYNTSAFDFDGAWADNGRLVVSNGAGVQTLTLAGGATKTILSIGGSSAGVTFDSAGNLYAGNGFDGAAGGSDTGYIKEFAKTAWETAAGAGGSTINFETTGTAVADLLSASAIGFDASGNLFVGGGDAFGGSGDTGYAAFVNAAAVQAALTAGSATPSINMNSSASILRKFTGNASPIWTYNDATGELYLRNFGENTVSVYAVPEPTALCGLLLAGVAGFRRRRKMVAGAAIAATSAAASVSSAAYVYNLNDFAVEVVSSTAMPGTSLYNEASAILGRPTLQFNSGNVATPDLHRAKLIEGTFNTGPSNEKLITTFNAGQSVTVRMGHAVTNDPSHPYGIDLNVFGNAFFTPNNTGGNTGDTTNLNTTTLGSIFAENARISVSPDNVNWYTYANGPTGDGYFPTNSYRWDRATATWSTDELDPTKPVDPAYRDTLTGLTAADALDRYNGAAGGAGFDLAESGFASISYVRFDGLTGYNGGEVDAVAAVTPEPAMLGLMALLGFAGLQRTRD
ncbi:MAG: hypothetical protein JWM57_3742 [Phycisphaerales bacterium]|nr:hypothetical protein [Phycisphaerales bacterium]